MAAVDLSTVLEGGKSPVELALHTASHSSHTTSSPLQSSTHTWSITVLGNTEDAATHSVSPNVNDNNTSYQQLLTTMENINDELVSNDTENTVHYMDMLNNSLDAFNTDYDNLSQLDYNYNDAHNVSTQYPSISALPAVEPQYWAIILSVVPFLTMFGNLLICISVYREKQLRTVTNYFIVSLAVADIMVATLVMPLAVYIELSFVLEIRH